MMCVSIAVVGRKMRFLSGRPRTFFASFCFLGANYCNIFCDDCSNFGSLGEVLAHGGVIPAILGVWERSLLMEVSFLFLF